MVLILEAGLVDQVKVDEVSGTPLLPGSLPVDRNPLGKIPALERNDGGVIYDSRVICRYLDDLAGASLYPDVPYLWETLTLEATADGIMDAAILMAYEVRLRPEGMRFPDWLEAQWTKVSRALDAIEEQWITHLNGPLDMSQVAVGCALAYLDLRHSARDWRAGRPKLAAWEAAFARRPSMLATRPPAA
jgi:glutathione S-transferase